MYCPLASIQQHIQGTVGMGISAATQSRYCAPIEDLDACWQPLWQDIGLKVRHIHRCNLGVIHEQSGRPAQGPTGFLTNAELPDMPTAQAGVCIGSRGHMAVSPMCWYVLKKNGHFRMGCVHLLTVQNHASAWDVCSYLNTCPFSFK